MIRLASWIKFRSRGREAQDGKVDLKVHRQKWGTLPNGRDDLEITFKDGERQLELVLSGGEKEQFMFQVLKACGYSLVLEGQAKLQRE